MTTGTEYKLPLPQPNVDDKAFWEGCKRHELLLQKCSQCGKVRYYPEPFCPKCLSDKKESVKASGKGTVWSWTTTTHAFGPRFKDVVPYTVVVVKLAEGLRMTSNLIDCKPEDIRVDMPVEVVFDDVTPEVTLPKFRPAKKA